MTYWAFPDIVSAQIALASVLAKDTFVSGKQAPTQYTVRWDYIRTLSDGRFVFMAEPGMNIPAGATVLQNDVVTPLLTGGVTAPVGYPVAKKATLRGVNLAGAEFGSPPGALNINYTFPTTTELLYYANSGVNCIRLPFLWERIQPVLGGPLDAAHVAWLKNFLIFHPNMNILLDVHNYGRYGGKIIGVDGPTNAQFADLWSKLAIQLPFKNAVFGLMNEPHDQDTLTWLGSANAAIAAIRATGATNLITVPGTSWTGAWSWTTSDNAAVMIGIIDPGNNFVYEVHQYFDIDGSGSNPDAVSATIGSERLQNVTAWARKNNVKLLLGEFGAANNPTMLAALADCVAYMNNNSDIWLGWTYWAGGPWWGNYMYSIEPLAGIDSAQMNILKLLF